MPKTPAERARDYRARKKLLKQQKPPAQTAAQRNREYRARQKALRNAAATIGESETPSTNFSGSHQANSSQCAMIPTSTTTTRTRKSCAQRCREYRQRKKTMEDANRIVVQRPVVSPVVVNISSNLSDIQVDPAQVLQPETMEIECDVPAISVVRRQSTSTHVPIDVNEQDTYSAYRQHYKAHQEFMDKNLRDILKYVQDTCDPSITSEKFGKTVESNQPTASKKAMINDKGMITTQVYIKEDPFSVLEVEEEKLLQSSCSANLSTTKDVPSSVAITRIESESPDPISCIILDEEEATVECVLKTQQETIIYVKLLEEFALLKADFRLIGLIDRLQEELRKN